MIKNIPLASRQKKSRMILARLMRGREFQKAKNIMTYIPLEGEVNTLPLVLEARVLGKNVFVPKIRARGRLDAVRIIEPARDLKRGAYGILEPKRVRGRTISPSRLDLVVVPGLGFDRKGRRLGKGKGYFDRFLKRAKGAKKIGLAFREQILKEVPMDSWDVPMDKVISA